MPESPDGALRVDLRPSFAVATVLVAVHAGAMLGAFALPFNPWSALMAAGVLLVSTWHTLTRHALRRGPAAVVAVAHSEAAGWRVTTATRECAGPCTLSSAFAHPRLTILSFSSPQGRIDVLVPEGASDPDEARRLRIMLRRLSARLETHSDGGVLGRAASSVRQCARRGRESLRARLRCEPEGETRVKNRPWRRRPRNPNLVPIDDTSAALLPCASVLEE